MSRSLHVFAIALAAAGCGEGITPNPVPLAGSPPTSVEDAGLPPAPDAAAGPFKRTVELRSPLGGPAGNLFADGDFDLSTEPAGASGQLGWVGFSADGSAQINVRAETGGLCKSGLRCGVLTSDAILLARGTAAAGAGNLFSVWAKPSPGDPCKRVRMVVLGCDTFQTIKTLKAADPDPDAGGWCQFTGSVGQRDSSLCLYLDQTPPGGGPILIDAATLLPDDGTVGAKSADVPWTPEAELLTKLAKVRETIEKSRRFGRDPIRRGPDLEP